MQERIDRIRRQREIEKQQLIDAQNKRIQDEQDKQRARELQEQEELERHPEIIRLMEVAQSKEVYEMMWEIYKWLTREPLVIYKPNLLGLRIMPTREKQLPFNLQLTAGNKTHSDSHLNHVAVSFNYKKISHNYNGFYEAGFQCTIVERNGNVKFCYWIQDSDAWGNPSDWRGGEFETIDEFMDAVAQYGV